MGPKGFKNLKFCGFVLDTYILKNNITLMYVFELCVILKLPTGCQHGLEYGLYHMFVHDSHRTSPKADLTTRLFWNFGYIPVGVFQNLITYCLICDCIAPEI